jgi:translation elongation factor EF-4
LSQESSWLGIAAIDAFFSWTEHVLIHIAILQGKLKTGEEVADLAAAEWAYKVKTVTDVEAICAQFRRIQS